MAERPIAAGRVHRCHECGAIKIRRPEDPIALVCPTCPELDADEAKEGRILSGRPRSAREAMSDRIDAYEYEREHPLKGGW